MEKECIDISDILCHIKKMNRANTKKHLDRLDQLTAILKSEGAMTVQRLSTELGVSTRTLFRDIALLRERGLPIDADKGRGGGIQLHRSWGVGRLTLENQEVIDLLLSLAIAESMNSHFFMTSLSSIKHKLMASFSAQQKDKLRTLRQRIHIGESASPHVLASYNDNLKENSAQTLSAQTTAPQKIETQSPLYSAFLFSKAVSIDYKDFHNVSTTRDIEPHYLYLSYPAWYILAWDKLRKDFRIFRCDRIENAILTEQSFDLRPLSDFNVVLTERNVRTL
ncbi:WYL domain-containing protein [Marinomonas sp. RSW2]|uniref:WYL domain-containing protein n=1 Tax=Marinomonas maritima TaxID=2940935 RepID=A0ABT5WAK8_9GAMM|nr:WYL domain-containing protein [Marinomonas maritima]MDE8601852.1 WYL domain-containing protein [Marinomonas maritima]